MLERMRDVSPKHWQPNVYYFRNLSSAFKPFLPGLTKSMLMDIWKEYMKIRLLRRSMLEGVIFSSDYWQVTSKPSWRLYPMPREKYDQFALRVWIKRIPDTVLLKKYVHRVVWGEPFRSRHEWRDGWVEVGRAYYSNLGKGMSELICR